MDKEYIKSEIKRLAKKVSSNRVLVVETGWYQEIDLNGVKTHNGNEFADKEVCDAILTLLPHKLAESRVLEIGANAGYYSAEIAKLGAKVTSLEIDNDYVNQSKFVKEVYEQNFGKLDWTILCEDVLTSSLSRFGRFDSIVCIGTISVLKSPGLKRVTDKLSKRERFIDNICHLSDLIIVSFGGREYHSRAYTTKSFNEQGFVLTGEVPTKALTIARFEKEQ